jgi:TrmH family RNA methyltransferase
MITSAQNPKLKIVRALLGRPKERRQAGAFVAEGVRLVEEALAAGWPFRFVLAGGNLGGRGSALVEELKTENVDVETVDEHLLQSLSETENTQGIIAVLELSPFPIPRELDFALILDQIRDPGNLGALLRTAASAGVQAVFLPPETADAFAPKVVRAGMGAHFRLPVLSLSWDDIRARTHGLKVYLAEMEGARSCWEADFRSPLALIIGGEAEGASQPARELAGEQIYIPMPGGTESLNAAAAGAILMFEVVRHRTKYFEKRNKW